LEKNDEQHTSRKWNNSRSADFHRTCLCFVMALYLDCLGRTPTRERFPLTCVERTRKPRSAFGWLTHR
jgi:hypothetical protein